jgi:hypothetical protein
VGLSFVKVGLYNQWVHTAGGGEKHSLAIAEVLATDAEVELITHEAIDLAALAAHLRLSLGALRVRYVDPSDQAVTRASADYDLFINASYMSLVRSRARRSALLVFFPNPIFSSRWSMWRARFAEYCSRRIASSGDGEVETNHPPGPADAWRALRSYDAIWANSEFTRRWVKHYWHRDAEVLYPPVDVEHFQADPQPRAGRRLPLIVSVGRFFRGGHSKRQDILVDAVRDLAGDLPAGWQVILAGGVGQRLEDWRYFEEVRAAASGLPITVWGDVPTEVLSELYSHAALYWHAAGFDRDERKDPAALEHFGITTVEAMAAGCVPLVHDSGGQAEIVRPGVDGYRWHALPELVALTRTLVADSALCTRLAGEARRSARRFSRRQFDTHATTLVDALVG